MVSIAVKPRTSRIKSSSKCENVVNAFFIDQNGFDGVMKITGWDLPDIIPFECMLGTEYTENVTVTLPPPSLTAPFKMTPQTLGKQTINGVCKAEDVEIIVVPFEVSR